MPKRFVAERGTEGVDHQTLTMGLPDDEAMADELLERILALLDDDYVWEIQDTTEET